MSSTFLHIYSASYSICVDFGESHYIGPIKGAQPDSEAWVDGFPHEAWLHINSFDRLCRHLSMHWPHRPARSASLSGPVRRAQKLDRHPCRHSACERHLLLVRIAPQHFRTSPDRQCMVRGPDREVVCGECRNIDIDVR